MKRSRRILTTLGLALALGATVPACLVHGTARVRTRGVVVVDAPPPPREERFEARSGYVWVRGNWQWNGNQYDWQAGHWEREKAGHAWSDGRWDQQNGGWVWVEGGWRTDGAHSTVIVNDGNRGGGNDRPRERDHRGGGGDTVVVVSGGPSQPPPSDRAENEGSRSGYIWIRGRWDWQNNNWETWVPGHWEREKANQSWRHGSWQLQGNVYVWVDGGWEKAERPKVRDHRN